MTTDDFVLVNDRKVFYNSFRLRAAISGEIALVRNSRTGINAINFKRRLCDVRKRELRPCADVNVSDPFRTGLAPLPWRDGAAASLVHRRSQVGKNSKRTRGAEKSKVPQAWDIVERGRRCQTVLDAEVKGRR